MPIHYAELSIARPPFLGGGTWLVTELAEITVLFGRNGGGKSALLRQLHEQAEPPITHYASPERTGDVVFDQGIFVQELEAGTRGAQRRGRNSALNYRRETISRVGSLQTLI